MNDWQKITIGNLVSLQRGYDLTNEERVDGAIPVFGAAGKNGYHNTAKADGPGIIVGRSGGSFGQIHYVNEAFWPHNTGLFVSDFKGNNPKFIYYLFKTLNFSSLNSGSAQPSLNRNYVYPINVNVPVVSEQNRIASVLSALDDKIELNNKINAELEAMAKTLYDYWFVQFDFPDANGKPYKSSGGKMVWNGALKREIPDGWEVKTIGDVISKIESGKRPKGGIDKNLKEGIPSLGAESIDSLGVFDYKSTKYIPFEYRDKIKSGIIQNNDILIYKDGAYVGKTTLFRDHFPFEFATINEHVFLVRTQDKNLQEYLLMTLMQNYYFATMQSLGKKAAQPGLNQEDFKNLKIILPNKSIIQEFRRKVDVLFEKLFLNSKQNHEVAQLRDWLLPMLMNGQVTVGVAEEKMGMVAEEAVEHVNH
jgi:type I restriction enzyme S subunit